MKRSSSSMPRTAIKARKVSSTPAQRSSSSMPRTATNSRKVVSSSSSSPTHIAISHSKASFYRLTASGLQTHFKRVEEVAHRHAGVQAQEPGACSFSCSLRMEDTALTCLDKALHTALPSVSRIWSNRSTLHVVADTDLAVINQATMKRIECSVHSRATKKNMDKNLSTLTRALSRGGSVNRSSGDYNDAFTLTAILSTCSGLSLSLSLSLIRP